MSRKKGRKFGKDGKDAGWHSPIAGGQTDTFEKRIEILTGLVLFAFGVYHSILYFGHTIVPNSDFVDLYRIGVDLLAFRLPPSFKKMPGVGLLQNLLCLLAWGSSPRLTAGWLLNAILHPFNVILLWLIGKRIIGRPAVWVALIASINRWIIYMLTEPIAETTLLFFVLLTVFLILRRSRWAYLAASIATMVRYEGAVLIMAVFVADIINKKDKRDIIKAFVFSALASAPLMIWLLLTVFNWQNEAGGTHYLAIFFSKEYAKNFVEGQGKRGILLHLQILWRIAFMPLFIPYPGSGENFAEGLFKLSQAMAIIGFVLGCIFAAFRRKWEVLILLLFFVPYFILHAYYPYPFDRFHTTIFWIAMLIVWLGLQSAGGLLARKVPIPRVVVFLFQGALAVAAAAWCISIALYFPQATSYSPVSASIPYVSMLLVGLFVTIRLVACRFQCVPRHICVASILCLMIASNQFGLAQLLGDGKREIEFKMLGEWFAQNARPGEKMAVYNDGPASLYAGKFAGNITGFPKEDSPEKLVEKLYEQNITYVVWATREGIGQRHVDYRFLRLDENIALLEKPRNIGPYEFVTQIGTNSGFVNVFRLKKRDPEQISSDDNQ